MTNNVSVAVVDMHFCAQDGMRGKRQRQIKLFHLKSRLEYIQFHILGPLHKTQQENQFVVIKLDRYKNPINVLLTSKTDTATVNRILFLALYGMVWFLVQSSIQLRLLIISKHSFGRV